MKSRVLLWANLSVWFLLIGGMLFDMIVVAVNWLTGDVNDILHWQAFFRVTNPGTFFYMKLLVLLTSILCVIAYWKREKTIQLLLVATLAVCFADMAFTMIHFLPINIYLGGKELDPVLVKQYASSWFTANYFRIALDVVGLFTSARAVHCSYLPA